MKGQIRELNISISSCKVCPFKEVGKYKYIDSNDTVDYCFLGKRTIYWSLERLNGFPEMCPLPIKNKKEETNVEEKRNS